MTTTISAHAVKELRERTGAPMMECKRALEATSGDIDQAISELRKSGVTKAGQKAGRVAAEGAIVIAEDGKQAAMVEINSETDFVARDHHFVTFINAVAKTALLAKAHDVSQLLKQPLQGHACNVEEGRLELIAKVGENVQIRRLVLSNPAVPSVGTYLHGNRIGVIVELDIDNKTLARDIAMHIAASKPLVITPGDVPLKVIAKEKEIYLSQATTSGKPSDIIEKMVAGRLKKYLDDVSLIGQPFVKDPEITVGSLLNKHAASVLAFYRYEVGEGIEKTSQDFKEAVMSQVQGSI